MKTKSKKKSKLTTFFIVLSLILGFLQVINLSRKNQIFTDTNILNEKNTNYFKIARNVESDWEISQGNGTIAIINDPSGTQEGDLLILHCTTDGQGSTLTGPIGWNILLPEVFSGQQTTASWYKIAGVTEPNSYNVTWTGEEGYVAGIIRITGHNETNPIQTTATDTGTGNIINPSVTTTKDHTLIIGFHGLDDDDPGDDYGSNLESGPTVLYAKSSVGTSNPCSAGIYYEIQTNQGGSLTRTWTMPTSEGWYAATVAINMKPPFINIISPTENEIFGIFAPNFTVEITDPNLDTMWYTLDGGINNHTFAENETINQAAWDALEDGGVTVRFYADNSLGDINFEQVNVIKDSSAPIIDIASPVVNEIFGVDPPSFIVEITDLNLDTMWYSISNNTYNSLNITFTDNETINPTEWGALHDGTYTIRFYANDTFGNNNFEEVDVIKDIYAIIINIVNPTENEVFGVNAPSFIVEIKGPFINKTWYTLDGAPKKYLFTVNETINQTAWMTLPDGIVSIRFYANDSLGEIYFKQVNVIKDTSSPNINIVNPTENQIFGVAAPSFSVEIVEANLDTMGYWIFNGSYQSLNVSFTDNGTIDQTEWDTLSNGDYTIRFYANDTIGNIDFEDVNVTKDIYAIFIEISNPIENEIFGVNAPNFIVKITCAFLNTTWYTMDGGLNNFTFTENETINEAAWDALSDAVINICFYANNSLGDINFKQVNVIKDASAPTINIVNPTENEVFRVDAPSFSVVITDPNLDTMWYTVNNSATKFIFTQDGVIDQTAWDGQANGDVILIFYANDTIGNLASENVIIRKSTPSGAGPDVTPTIVLISVIVGVAVPGIALGILIKQGKISLDKFSIKKLSFGKSKTDKPPKVRVKKKKTKKLKIRRIRVKKEKTPTESNNT